ncbi:MAG: 50S ribosomal protein L18 [Alphaproteobacteria bacterium MarineAlpha5_Bin11]|nr:MAG: 50S ribosomal protein L18 [Alphaproteobacteria bacterium MarineAlpha5_Bin11]PPR51754.1 MAG: 50S ribosomal protein L18 [Alphaproteobacteria bacterium MarineAlpha5_Bin10]
MKKINLKTRRKLRNRKKIRKYSDRNRLSVFRSNKNIYAQIIDDKTGKTIVSASSMEKEITTVESNKDFNIEEKVGTLIAERSLKKGLKKVVFDKGSYTYHGRIKALAESARKSGLEF